MLLVSFYYSQQNIDYGFFPTNYRPVQNLSKWISFIMNRSDWQFKSKRLVRKYMLFQLFFCLFSFVSFDVLAEFNYTQLSHT